MLLDYIVVGQGLAGTALAFELLKRGRKFLVIDQFKAHSPSQVAAGLINPVISRNLNAYWRAGYFMDAAHLFYQDLQSQMNRPVYTGLNMIRLFSSEEEREKLLLKIKSTKNPFLGDVIDRIPPKIRGKAGGIEIKGVAYLDMKTMISEARELLWERNLLKKEKFDHNQLDINEDLLKYASLESKRIIFSEGPAVAHNPFFPNLPFAWTKGELLTVEIDELAEDTVFSRGHNLIPIANHRYKFGATYAWDFDSSEPSYEARKVLESSLKKLIKGNYQVLLQEAGIRPSVRDRKPLLGPSAVDDRLFLFNGLGSHGAMMAPVLARDLLDFIEKGKPLMDEIRVDRSIREHSN